jgi:hypothetical protein
LICDNFPYALLVVYNRLIKQPKPNSTSESAPVLEMRGVSKRFDTTQALDAVALTLYPGEIHADQDHDRHLIKQEARGKLQEAW